MAKIKGTNGDDNLIGTAGDDTIVGYLGMDTVDGGAGYDVLTIDYGAVTGSVFPGNVTLNDDGTLSGGISSGVFGAPNVTAFETIERLVYTGSQDVDYITVDLGTLAFVAKRLVMDGGAGNDVLSVAIDGQAGDTLSGNGGVDEGYYNASALLASIEVKHAT